MARRFLPLLVTALLLSPVGPAAAQEGDEAAKRPAERTAELADRLQHLAAHFEQMNRALRENPELEERWTAPATMKAALRTSRRARALADELARWTSHLEEVRSDREALEGSGLGKRVESLSRATAGMISALERIVAGVDSLRGVVHGGHAHGGG